MALPGQLVRDVTDAVAHAINPNAVGAVPSARAVQSAAGATRASANVTPFRSRRAAATAGADKATVKPVSAAAKRSRQAA